MLTFYFPVYTVADLDCYTVVDNEIEFESMFTSCGCHASAC